MKVYKTVFTNKWEVCAKDTDHLKLIGMGDDTVTDWSPKVGHYGNCYDNRFYLTEEAAWKYIHREPVPEELILRIKREA